MTKLGPADPVKQTTGQILFLEAESAQYLATPKAKYNFALKPFKTQQSAKYQLHLKLHTEG